ncbi:c-type cytochrome [Microbulbifer sp. 2201CG32-9]|uniref:c-type cytochrome n=1 Tax=Microbulbifer sp. 2201CG32-9 TaxID=3232309 RepID=UPI00345C25D2
MKSIINNTAVALVLGLAGALGVATATAQGDPNAGQAKVATCAACHGTDGNSIAPAFPKIAGQGEKYLFKQLMDIKSGARAAPQMIGQLDNSSEQDLRDMAAYFASQQLQVAGAQPISVMLNSGENVDGLALGRDLYRAGNPATGVPACMGCHSPSGLGNEPAGYPRLGGQYAGYIEAQLKAFRTGTRANDGDTRVMRSVAKQLSDAEIKALSQYIAGLTP